MSLLQSNRTHLSVIRNADILQCLICQGNHSHRQLQVAIFALVFPLIGFMKSFHPKEFYFSYCYNTEYIICNCHFQNDRATQGYHQRGHQTTRIVSHTIWRITNCLPLKDLGATSVDLCASLEVHVWENEVKLNRSNTIQLTGGKLEPQKKSHLCPSIILSNHLHIVIVFMIITKINGEISDKNLFRQTLFNLLVKDIPSLNQFNV